RPPRVGGLRARHVRVSPRLAGPLRRSRPAAARGGDGALARARPQHAVARGTPGARRGRARAHPRSLRRAERALGRAPDRRGPEGRVAGAGRSGGARLARRASDRLTRGRKAGDEPGRLAADRPSRREKAIGNQRPRLPFRVRTLLAIQLEVLFARTPSGELLATRDPTPRAAPRVFVGRSVDGNVWALRA